MGVWLALLWTALASGEVPLTVRPSIAPWDIQQQYGQWAKNRGEKPEKLACRVYWTDAAQLCFRMVDGNRRDWVTEAHLAEWGVDFTQLRTLVMRRGTKAVAEQLKPIEIAGMNQRYWLATNQGGWGSAVLLSPTTFRAVVPGPNVLAAVPAHGVVILWNGGYPEVDKIVAIGVREIYGSKSGSVTPVIYRWTGDEWVPFVEAKKRPGPK